MTLDAKLANEIIAGAGDATSESILRDALTLYAILEGVKFPKGTKLKGGGLAIEVHSPGVPVYEIRMKDRF